MNRILFMLALVFFTATAFTSLTKTTDTQTDPTVFKLMQVTSLWDLLKDGYEPDRDRDGTWLTEGMRSKYALAKKYAALTMLETAFGKKVFLSGPHNGEMDYLSDTEFGHYNPDFIADFRWAWETAIQNPAFKEVLKKVYYEDFQGMATTYFDAYHFINQNPQFLKGLQDKYESSLNSGGGVYIRRFTDDFANLQTYYNSSEASTAPAFWLRRSLDGTALQLLELQVMMMQTFELDFTAIVSEEEKEAYEALIQKTLPTLNPAIPNQDYPDVTNDDVRTNTGDLGTLIDDRDDQMYHWVELKDGKKWMAQNLNYSFAGSTDEDCSFCQTYGRLYTWELAQKACPSGWRLPTETDWDNLIEAYGDKYKAYDALAEDGPSGFSALLGGQRDVNGNFDQRGSEGYYWGSSANNDNKTWEYTFFSYDGAKINKYEANKENAYSCRCLWE